MNWTLSDDNTLTKWRQADIFKFQLSACVGTSCHSHSTRSMLMVLKGLFGQWATWMCAVFTKWISISVINSDSGEAVKFKGQSWYMDCLIIAITSIKGREETEQKSLQIVLSFSYVCGYRKNQWVIWWEIADVLILCSLTLPVSYLYLSA